MEELKYWIWLSGVFSPGSDKPKLLLEHFKSPERIYSAGTDELSRLSFIGKRELKRLEDKSLDDAVNIIKDCEKNKIKIVTYSQKLYPNKLKNIFGAPILLYYFGDISKLNEQVVITIVGTRKAHEYGKTVTCNMAMQLSSAGVLIVSGCAVGIDTFAHKGALMANGNTVAVLGCGLLVDYPSENHNLKLEIIKQGGALISELPPRTAVNGRYFPVRNRILAGLSDGVLVTEAPLRSGSLITAEHAIEQGKDLFCIPPADIYSSAYSGVKRYIRDGAVTVCDVEDILREYEHIKPHSIRQTLTLINNSDNYSERDITKKRVEPCVVVYKDIQIKEDEISGENPEKEKRFKEFDLNLSDDCKRVYEAIGEAEPHINDICERTGMPISKLLAVLTELELAGMIIAMSGRRYKKA